MATAKTSSPLRRASDVAPGIGRNLDDIINRDVALLSYEITERSITRRQDDDNAENAEVADSGTNGRAPRVKENATIVLMRIAINPDDLDKVTTFHAWSESLADKLREIPQDSLPLLINFRRVQTAGGFRVWSFE